MANKPRPNGNRRPNRFTRLFTTFIAAMLTWGIILTLALGFGWALMR